MRLIFSALLAICVVTAANAGWSITEMNKQIDQTNVLMNDNCSGTLIDAKRGYVLTANHCIQDQFEIIDRQKIDGDGVVKTEKVRVAKRGTFSYLNFKDSDETSRSVYTYTIKLSDDQLDLAIVQTKAKLPETAQAPIACVEPIRGEKVYAVGNPYAILYSSLTEGIVSSTDRNYKMLHIDSQGDNRLIQFSAVIAGGNSGGALYNDNGELVGVNVRGGASGIAVAVPLADIKKVLMRESMTDLYKRCETKDNQKASETNIP